MTLPFGIIGSDRSPLISLALADSLDALLRPVVPLAIDTATRLRRWGALGQE